jgi:phenylalanyl-tRNA synthetase beta chain
MKLSWRWIREFVETPLSAADAADRLVAGGIEVTSVMPVAPSLSGVVVGEVEAIERDLGPHRGHRNQLVRVSTGRERFSVVCGAPNCVAGMRAAFAPPGAVLAGERKIETARIRGTESQGMLCSERELGLSDDDAGILKLDDDAPLGADLRQLLGLDDTVLEVDVMPNRPDCLSIIGIARELAALTGATLRPASTNVVESNADAHALARIRVDDPELCARYAARVIEDVRVGPSPSAVAFRLRAVGLRPISNVVDATNYVLWELGHPLHAFDYDTVGDHTIVVRRARGGERFTTLDGQERVLTASMLVIADPDRAIGLAGVMGGANTEVSAGTTRVLLESAYFHPASIRRTSRALGLRTDAAYRFERGADIEGLRGALDRTARMLAELSGGSVARGVLDVYPSPRPRPQVRVRTSRVRRLIGSAPPVEESAAILTGLGLSPRRDGDDLHVEVPSFRRDLAMEDDLVEEIVRIWGYDRIPSTVGPRSVEPVKRPPSAIQDERLREALVGAGLHEVVTWVFEDAAFDPAPYEGLESDGRVRLLNPLAQDAALLHPSLVPGMLRVIATNVRRQQPDVAIFEIGKHFTGGQAGEPPRESRWLAILLTGSREAPGWYSSRRPADVFDAKGLAEHALAALDIRDVTTDRREGPLGAPAHFEPGRAAWLKAGDRRVAVFGEMAHAYSEPLGILTPVYAALIPLDVAVTIVPPPVVHVALPRYPSVQRDLALVLPDRLAAADVEAVLRGNGGPHLRAVTVFDLYQGEGIAEGHRSLAWRLTYRADDRTLTDAEVNEMRDAAVDAVRRRFGVNVRT